MWGNDQLKRTIMNFCTSFFFKLSLKVKSCLLDFSQDTLAITFFFEIAFENAWANLIIFIIISLVLSLSGWN